MRTLSSWLLFAFALIWAAPAHATTILDVPNPRDSGAWVTDLADVLSDADEETINVAIDAIEEETGVEIALVTVDQVTAPSTKDFTTGLFNLWGVGKSDANNGLLIVLVMGERRLEMETGYGLESVLTDGWLATMQAEKMVPHFKQENFGPGLVSGVNAVIERLRAYAEELPQTAGEARPKSTLVRLADSNSDGATRSEEDPPTSGAWCCCGILVLLLVWSIGRRKRATRCPHCETRLVPMPDSKVETILTNAQRLERAIGSRRFTFLECPGCQHSKVIYQDLRNFNTCPQCDRRTLEIRVETLVTATTSSPGRRRLFENCLNCNHKSHHDETTPRVPKTTSSTSRTVIIRDDDDDDDDRGGFFSSSSSSSSSSWSDSNSSSSDSSSWSAGNSSSSGSSSGSSRRKKSSGSFGGGKSGGGGAGSSW
ncbi:TPM domain-containing protein [Lujinxingia sediminis]|nr:TPM domain-containing protein [Lujinxingia sediminis]